MAVATRTRETVPKKATRLVKNYRTILTSLSTAIVIGDHDTYELTRFGQHWTCQCPWARYRGHIKPCSHILAVTEALDDPASQAPVQRLAGMLGNRGL